jgi:5'-3' exonuclease
MLDKHSLVSIIDADTLVYLCAYRAKECEDTSMVLGEVDNFVQTILANTSCTHYIAFLGGTKCFRYDIAVTKPYKGDRPPSPDWYIKWGGVIKAHLRDKWKFVVVNNIEADDAVSIASEELKFLDINHILVHADKDIRQKSGNHYNLRTHKREYISPIEALKNLYRQILIGDNTDSIQGLKGVGKKRAAQYIDHLNIEYEMATQCRLLFDNKYHDRGKIYEETLTLCKLLDRANPYTHLELDYIEVKRDTIMDEVIADIWG